MKTICGVVILCALLLCATTSEAARVERSLKGFFDDEPTDAYAFSSSSCDAVNSECNSEVAVSSEAYSEAVYKIKKAFKIAFIAAENGEEAKAIAVVFAKTVAFAYAELISSYTIKLEAEYGSKACAYAKSGGEATATAIAEVVLAAFSKAENKYAKAAAGCMSETVSVATATIVQKIDKKACVKNGFAYLSEYAKMDVFVGAVAKAFGIVIAAVKDDDAFAASLCVAYADSFIDFSG